VNKKNDITIAIPVKDEAKNLLHCLNAMTFSDYIVVIDSNSKDGTREIAESKGIDLVDFNWDGKFPKKRNWILRNYSFTTEWVLFLDADEFVTEEFISEVRLALKNTSHVGFWLNYENHFMGKKLRGGDPQRKLALFRVGAGEYEKIEEDHWSHLDMEVHEHPVLEGSVGEIKTPIEHNDFRGLEHYIEKHNAYSSWEAHRYHRLHQHPGSQEWEGLTDRQKKKYRNLGKWWFAPAYFFATFIFKKGFLDGATGFHFALMKAIYFYQIRLKIKELEKSGK